MPNGEVGVKVKCYLNDSFPSKHSSHETVKIKDSFMLLNDLSEWSDYLVVCVATVLAVYFSYCVVNMEGLSSGALIT